MQKSSEKKTGTAISVHGQLTQNVVGLSSRASKVGQRGSRESLIYEPLRPVSRDVGWVSNLWRCWNKALQRSDIRMEGCVGSYAPDNRCSGNFGLVERKALVNLLSGDSLCAWLPIAGVVRSRRGEEHRPWKSRGLKD